MVQVIQQPRPLGDYWWQKVTGSPLIHIYSVERHVHGNGIKIMVHGEIKIAAGEIVYARELKLNTLDVLKLTPEVCRGQTDGTTGIIANKWIYRKGEYDNFASIDIYDDDGTWLYAGLRSGLSDGSVWLDFDAKGE